MFRPPSLAEAQLTAGKTGVNIDRPISLRAVTFSFVICTDTWILHLHSTEVQVQIHDSSCHEAQRRSCHSSQDQGLLFLQAARGAHVRSRTAGSNRQTHPEPMAMSYCSAPDAEPPAAANQWPELECMSPLATLMLHPPWLVPNGPKHRWHFAPIKLPGSDPNPPCDRQGAVDRSGWLEIHRWALTVGETKI